MHRALLFSLFLSTMVLAAAPQPQPVRRPLVFEPNQGQAPSHVKWIARGPGYQIFFTGDGVTMRMAEHTAHASGPSGYSTLHMTFPGSRAWNKIEGLNPTGGISNYVRGKDAQNSLTQIPNYARINVASVYDGVDLVFYSRGGDLEYDFVIHPDARPENIRLAFEGQRRMRVDEKSGDLVLVTPAGSELHQVLPKVYQQTGDQHTEIAGRYQMLTDKRVAFRLAPYDHSRALVIDPVVSFTRFLSGSDYDLAFAVAVDGAGNSYVTGVTYSSDFPIVNGYFSQWQDCAHDLFGFCFAGDGFVTKLAPDGTILFSTFLPPGRDFGIAVDSTGLAVAGEEVPGADPDIPTQGGADAYVVRLNLSTGVPVFFYFYAGSDDDVATSVAFDSQHNIWVAGYTRSNDFVGQTGARLGGQDVFVAKLGPSGQRLYTQTFGSDGEDFAYALAVDPADQPWVTGSTCGTGWPNFGGPIHQANGCAVFVMQLDTTGHTLMSTVIGGSSGGKGVLPTNGSSGAGDAGLGILPNGSNAAYVTGYTHAANFPTTAGAFITSTTATGSQAFLTMIDSSTGIGHIIHSTLLGNDGDTRGYALASGGPKGVFVAGSTSSVQFPGAPPLVPNPTAGFVSKFSFDLSRLEYTKLLGADAFGVAVRNSTDTLPPVKEIFVAGDRYTAGRSLDAFVVKLDEDPLDYYASLRFADVNGDGKPDICGRGMEGVYCALNTGNGTFGAANLWETAFSDAGGWGLPQYGNTMMFADINGDGKADVCGRGQSGIYCELSTGTGFSSFFLAHSGFSDAGGWNLLNYYASLRFADVNGDGKPDICGRGQAGVYCTLNTGSGMFGPMTLWETAFSDTGGWGLPQYGNTMMFADINGDGKRDVCGRGAAGIYCELSAGTGFGSFFLAQSFFSDANGWNLY